jgi:peptidoglycan-associated lipoprotein
MLKRILGVGLVSLLIVLLGIAAGCGKKEPVETDVTVPAEVDMGAEVPETPEPEPAPETYAAPAPDYGAMDPAEYGIEDVFFAFDEYSLSDEAMRLLAANARIMREHADLVWMLEGHCDERGTVEYNLALGEKRAHAARDYLISLGVPAAQLRTTSYGEERPFANGHDESAWSLNRRAHFARP